MRTMASLGRWKLSRTVRTSEKITAQVSGTATISPSKEVKDGIQEGSGDNNEPISILRYEETGEMVFEGRSQKVPVSKSYFLRIPGKAVSEQGRIRMSELGPFDVHFARDDKGEAVSVLDKSNHYVTFVKPTEKCSPDEKDPGSKECTPNGNGITTFHSSEHLCGADLYRANLCISAEDEFLTECIVKGPKKDFTIETKYAAQKKK
uniref:DUF6314 domain-containing protein n=1 Tax=Lotharella globosa TaxID=91324 RepID=A0A7S3ZA41_9EUKA|mmetsp:Transcript_37370/g.72021  ORF Transcript_37370/g.72021 Transcript_37370/m.72021 type:complete len:206 (+) Transcript_37370:45-662(+)